MCVCERFSCCCHQTVLGRRAVPGGRASARRSIGDILSTANVVTPAAPQTKSLPRILGEPPPQMGPNEIASGAKSNQGTETQHKELGDGEAKKRKRKSMGGAEILC